MALSAEVLHPSTSNRHINNLAKILPKQLLGRKHLIILADNGPDWAMCYANIMSFGRLWKELGLERLTIIHYSPNHSRFNFIERRWGGYYLIPTYTRTTFWHFIHLEMSPHTIYTLARHGTCIIKPQWGDPPKCCACWVKIHVND